MHQGQAARRAAALRAAARGAGLAYWELTHLLANWLLLDRQKNIKWGWRRCGRELCNAFGPSCAHRFFGRFQRQQQRMNAAWLQHAACSCSVAAQQSPRQPPARYPQQQRAPGAAALMSQRRGGGGTVEFVVKLAYNVTAGVHINIHSATSAHSAPIWQRRRGGGLPCVCCPQAALPAPLDLPS